MSSLIVPPGGFAGFQQMTPASKIALGARSGARATGRRRRRRKASSTRSTRSSRTKAKSRMKFGSPAWQKKYRVGKFAKKRK